MITITFLNAPTFLSKSAMTTMPQKSKKQTKIIGEGMAKNNGATKQQQADNPKAKLAVFFTPIFSEI